MVIMVELDGISLELLAIEHTMLRLRVIQNRILLLFSYIDVVLSLIARVHEFMGVGALSNFL